MTCAAASLRDEVGRHRADVGERLVEEPGQLLGQLPGVGAHDQLVVVGAELLGDDASVVELVEVGLFEADAERLGARAELGHRADDGGRVDAAREEGTDGDVGDEVRLHGAAHQLADLLDRVGFGDLALGDARQIPVAADAQLALAVAQDVARRQLARRPRGSTDRATCGRTTGSARWPPATPCGARRGGRAATSARCRRRARAA